MAETFVIQRHVTDVGEGYLVHPQVDANGAKTKKLIYYFWPESLEKTPQASLWPLPSRDWVGEWKPLLVSKDQLGKKLAGHEAYALAEGVIDDRSGYVDASHFCAVRRTPVSESEGGTGTDNGREAQQDVEYQIWWGFEDVNGKKWWFWRLYVYEDDLDISNYHLSEMSDRPPGWVVPVWMAAESKNTKGSPEPKVNPERLKKPIGPPVGGSYSGGP